MKKQKLSFTNSVLLILFVIIVEHPCLFASADELKSAGEKVAEEVLIGVNSLFDGILNETLVLIIPDETGNFILENFGDYSEENMERKREFVSNNFSRRVKELFGKNTYQGIIFRVGEDVNYNYLYHHYIAVLDDIQKDYQVYKSTDKYLHYAFGPPIKARFNIKKKFLPLNE